MISWMLKSVPPLSDTGQTQIRSFLQKTINFFFFFFFLYVQKSHQCLKRQNFKNTFIRYISLSYNHLHHHMQAGKRRTLYIHIPFLLDTNLIPSNSLTHADRGMASVGSRWVSSFTDYPCLTGLPEKTVSKSSHGTTGSKLLKAERMCPKRGNKELA